MKMQIEEAVCLKAAHEIDGTIQITDPCYDEGTWCRMSLDVKPGKWIFEAEKSEEGRIASISMRYAKAKTPSVIETTGEIIGEMIGEIEVDAGLAGFFTDKPDFSDEEWYEFCDKLGRAQCWEAYFDGKFGFFSSSGWGDGSYPVVVSRDRNDDIISVSVLFMYEEDEF